MNSVIVIYTVTLFVCTSSYFKIASADTPSDPYVGSNKDAICSLQRKFSDVYLYGLSNDDSLRYLKVVPVDTCTIIDNIPTKLSCRNRIIYAEYYTSDTCNGLPTELKTTDVSDLSTLTIFRNDLFDGNVYGSCMLSGLIDEIKGVYDLTAGYSVLNQQCTSKLDRATSGMTKSPLYTVYVKPGESVMLDSTEILTTYSNDSNLISLSQQDFPESGYSFANTSCINLECSYNSLVKLNTTAAQRIQFEKQLEYTTEYKPFYNEDVKVQIIVFWCIIGFASFTSLIGAAYQSDNTKPKYE